MRPKSRRYFVKLAKFLIKPGLALFALLAYCEFGIYYVVLFQCAWPALFPGSDSNHTSKAMFLADTHLLGPIKGHWWDKLRREWQMHRAFQTAITIFAPEAVFFLGDVFDEGLWVDSKHFESYFERFNSLFSLPPGTKQFVVVGNHDIGFHYWVTPELNRRFNKAFNSSAVETVRLKGSTFVLVNSMAMDGDGCFLCSDALAKLNVVSERLGCNRDQPSVGCESRPILLQHFPLYRDSDAMCTGLDSAPEPEKNTAFREKWDCLSKSSTEFLLAKINPRLVMSGHTHHGCLVFHNSTTGGKHTFVPEHSVPSFSWRNRNDPSFYLGVFTRNDYRVEKCPMPTENTVIRIYIIGLVCAMHYFVIQGLLFICRLIQVCVGRRSKSSLF